MGKILIVPHLILKNNDQVLLIRRSNSAKIWPGRWHYVTGKIEDTESPKETIIREAEEEIGIKLKEVCLGTTIFLIEKDCFDPSKKFYGLELFFIANLAKEDNPNILEPLKHDRMDWFSPSSLPEPIVPGVEFGIKSYFNNQRYAEFCNF